LLEALLQAALNLFTPTVLGAWLLGTIVGVILGVIPVIGGITGAALFLPFIFMMDPEVALPFLLAMMAVCYTGGAVPSILINIPGTAANAPTMLDGYPMTRKGEAGRALGAAFMSSCLGGIVTVPLALLMIPIIIPLVLALWSAEMFFLVVMGLSFLAILGSGGQIKGLIAGGLGILLSLVGYDTVTGIPRYTLGILGLFDGINLIAVLLGLFGLAEIIDLATKGQPITQTGKVQAGIRDLWEGAKDVFRHWWLWLRCSILGYVIGVIPGIGAGMATFTAYAHAKQTSKYPEEFGTGRVEGVIAPEAANNAKEAGSVLTTLAFGIPGSTEMVIILGAFWMVGIVPGPGLLTEHLELSLTMFLTIIVANLVGAAIVFVTVRYLVKLTTVHQRYLFCIILSIIFVGVFVNGEHILSIPIVIVFGILGFLMKRFNYPRPSLALGFVLGALFEHYLNLSLMTVGPLFFLRPISLIIIAITILVLAYGPIRSIIGRRKKRVITS
jgi:putative tricarboxylic transport membrane protein